MPIDPKTPKATESGDQKPVRKLTTAEMSVLGLGLMALVGGLLLGWDAVWAMLFAAIVTAAVAAGAHDPSNLDASNVAAGAAKPEPEQNAARRQRKLEGLVIPGETRLPATHPDAYEPPRPMRVCNDRAGRRSR
jgi:hypothetical protein